MDQLNSRLEARGRISELEDISQEIAQDEVQRHKEI